jgi:hypothetical protein
MQRRIGTRPIEAHNEAKERKVVVEKGCARNTGYERIECEVRYPDKRRMERGWSICFIRELEVDFSLRGYGIERPRGGQRGKVIKP